MADRVRVACVQLTSGADKAAIDRIVARKIEVVADALDRVAGRDDALDLLAALGGFEIAALTGFVTGAAAEGVPVIVDGLIAQTALLVATRLEPAIAACVIAAHRSKERASPIVLDAAGVEPLLDLGLGLGEGTGALLALPLVQAAARVMAEMASFASAGASRKAATEKKPPTPAPGSVPSSHSGDE